MAVHNGGRFLGAALASIRDQTLDSWEAIIVDDGSTDGTGTMLAQVSNADSRVRVIRIERRGQTRALNHGLGLVRGETIARLDADDVMAPERLQRQYEFLAAAPDVALVGSDGWIIDGDGVRVGRISRPSDDAGLRRALIRGNPFIHSSVMIRTQIIEAVGPYDERFLPAQDYELWMRIAERHRVASIAEPLVFLRKHDSSMSMRMGRRQALESVSVQLAAIGRRQYPRSAVVHVAKWLLYWPQPALADRVVQQIKRRCSGATSLF